MTKKQIKKKIDKLSISSLIDHSIYVIRGHRVMLDEDLARIYGVETKALNQAIRRNKDRFPEGFMFQLSNEEYVSLRSQTVTSKRGGRRYMPYVFTEHGTVMLASVLRSKRAIQMNIGVIEAFVRLRRALLSQEDMLKQLAEIRSFMLKSSNKTDREIRKIWTVIENLANPDDYKTGEPIGFNIEM